MGDQRFWVSWWQPGDDYRPLTFPPGPAILGWWCSGHREEETTLAAAICALVRASSEDDAKAAVAKDWPESKDAEWRFFDAAEADYVPGDRFPLSDWMRERIALLDAPAAEVSDG